MRQATADPRPYIPVLFISDTHLFKDNANAAALLELLENMRCGAIFFMGDLTDMLAKARNDKRHAPNDSLQDRILRIDEMHLRVFDAINKKRHEDATKLFFCPGNHDNGARPLFRPGFEAQKQAMEKKLGMTFLPAFIFKTNAGKRYLAFHGDQMDPYFVRHFLYHIADYGYESIAKIFNSKTASVTKKITKFVLSRLGHQGRLHRVAQKYGVQGTISGHTHLPGHEKITRKGALVDAFNSGSFIDGDPHYLAVNAEGTISVLNWAEQRKSLNLPPVPTSESPNNAASYRPQTLSQIQTMLTDLQPLCHDEEELHIRFPEPSTLAEIRQSDLIPKIRAIPPPLPQKIPPFLPPGPAGPSLFPGE